MLHSSHQQFNVVSKALIDSAIADYAMAGLYETDTMKKLAPTQVQQFTETCEKVLGQKLKFQSGNYYHHSLPYLPHTDFIPETKNTLNVVIPLRYAGELAHLIVFDQWWDKSPVTWCLDYPVIEFKVNKGVLGIPADYPIKEARKNHLDETFHSKYLSHHRRECFYGLSGSAYPFQPGSLIFFDNRRIHCTSQFQGEKLGLSLRFSVEC